ncbi:hypothetical protein HDU99_008975, partial [Rhizoclosmatium hyalinum]
RMCTAVTRLTSHTTPSFIKWKAFASLTVKPFSQNLRQTHLPLCPKVPKLLIQRALATLKRILFKSLMLKRTRNLLLCTSNVPSKVSYGISLVQTRIWKFVGLKLIFLSLLPPGKWRSCIKENGWNCLDVVSFSRKFLMILVSIF